MTELLTGVTVPVFLLINKVDLVDKEPPAAADGDVQRLFPFREIVPVSAQKGDGVERLVELVCSYLPAGPAYFPDDILTDLPERFVVAEMIREKVFRLTRDEDALFSSRSGRELHRAAGWRGDCDSGGDLLSSVIPRKGSLSASGGRC